MKSLVYSNIAEAYGTLNGIFSFNYFPNNHIHKTQSRLACLDWEKVSGAPLEHGYF